jgi:GTP-binding protein
MLNFFNVDETCYFVDLPGYGYAKAPARLRRSWKPLVERYLTTSPDLRGVVQLVDARQPPSELDRAMLRFLESADLPTLVVFTKVDKLGSTSRASRLAGLRAGLGLADLEQVVAFSAVTREGREDILAAIQDLIAGRPVPATGAEPLVPEVSRERRDF